LSEYQYIRITGYQTSLSTQLETSSDLVKIGSKS